MQRERQMVPMTLGQAINQIVEANRTPLLLRPEEVSMKISQVRLKLKEAPGKSCSSVVTTRAWITTGLASEGFAVHKQDVQRHQ